MITDNTRVDKGLIYGIKIDGTFKYIGKTLGSHRINDFERKKEHIRLLKRNAHISKELKKYTMSRKKIELYLSLLKHMTP